MSRRTLWLRWVLANGFGELFGLGLTLLVGAAVITRLGDQTGVSVILLAFGLAVASGAIEATLVGLAQWWAMHPCFPAITRLAWWLATLLGALVAYAMGYLPSTLMSLGEQSTPSGAAAAEPAQWLILLLAAGLGAIAGIVLSFAQWLAMRRKIARAIVWIPANMLAWMVGMPIIFWGIDQVQKLSALPLQLLLAVLILLLVGLIVGAIHGAFLVYLYKVESLPNPKTGGIISAF